MLPSDLPIAIVDLETFQSLMDLMEVSLIPILVYLYSTMTVIAEHYDMYPPLLSSL